MDWHDFEVYSINFHRNKFKDDTWLLTDEQLKIESNL